jgi:hypothetical protein
MSDQVQDNLSRIVHAVVHGRQHLNGPAIHEPSDHQYDVSARAVTWKEYLRQHPDAKPSDFNLPRHSIMGNDHIIVAYEVSVPKISDERYTTHDTGERTPGRVRGPDGGWADLEGYRGAVVTETTVRRGMQQNGAQGIADGVEGFLYTEGAKQSPILAEAQTSFNSQTRRQETTLMVRADVAEQFVPTRNSHYNPPENRNYLSPPKPLPPTPETDSQELPERRTPLDMQDNTVVRMPDTSMDATPQAPDPIAQEPADTEAVRVSDSAQNTQEIERPNIVDPVVPATQPSETTPLNERDARKQQITQTIQQELGEGVTVRITEGKLQISSSDPIDPVALQRLGLTISEGDIVNVNGENTLYIRNNIPESLSLSTRTSTPPDLSQRPPILESPFRSSRDLHRMGMDEEMGFAPSRAAQAASEARLAEARRAEAETRAHSSEISQAETGITEPVVTNENNSSTNADLDATSEGSISPAPAEGGANNTNIPDTLTETPHSSAPDTAGNSQHASPSNSSAPPSTRMLNGMGVMGLGTSINSMYYGIKDGNWEQITLGGMGALESAADVLELTGKMGVSAKYIPGVSILSGGVNIYHGAQKGGTEGTIQASEGIYETGLGATTTASAFGLGGAGLAKTNLIGAAIYLAYTDVKLAHELYVVTKETRAYGQELEDKLDVDMNHNNITAQLENLVPPRLSNYSQLQNVTFQYADDLSHFAGAVPVAFNEDSKYLMSHDIEKIEQAVTNAERAAHKTSEDRGFWKTVGEGISSFAMGTDAGTESGIMAGQAKSAAEELKQYKQDMQEYQARVDEWATKIAVQKYGVETPTREQIDQVLEDTAEARLQQQYVYLRDQGLAWDEDMEDKIKAQQNNQPQEWNRKPDAFVQAGGHDASKNGPMGANIDIHGREEQPTLTKQFQATHEADKTAIKGQLAQIEVNLPQNDQERILSHSQQEYRQTFTI